MDTAEPTVLKVQRIDLNIRQNTRAHHTDEFDITNQQLSPYKYEFLVVRRGQSFELTLEFDRPWDRERDDIRIVFRFGKTLNLLKNMIHVHLYLTKSSK